MARNLLITESNVENLPDITVLGINMPVKKGLQGLAVKKATLLKKTEAMFSVSTNNRR